MLSNISEFILWYWEWKMNWLSFVMTHPFACNLIVKIPIKINKDLNEILLVFPSMNPIWVLNFLYSISKFYILSTQHSYLYRIEEFAWFDLLLNFITWHFDIAFFSHWETIWIFFLLHFSAFFFFMTRSFLLHLEFFCFIIFNRYWNCVFFFLNFQINRYRLRNLYRSAMTSKVCPSHTIHNTTVNQCPYE